MMCIYSSIIIYVLGIRHSWRHCYSWAKDQRSRNIKKLKVYVHTSHSHSRSMFCSQLCRYISPIYLFAGFRKLFQTTRRDQDAKGTAFVQRQENSQTWGPAFIIAYVRLVDNVTWQHWYLTSCWNWYYILVAMQTGSDVLYTLCFWRIASASDQSSIAYIHIRNNGLTI